MSTPATKVLRMPTTSPQTREEERAKKDFDNAMREIRFQVKHAGSRDAREYFLRELMKETRPLARALGVEA